MTDKNKLSNRFKKLTTPRIQKFAPKKQVDEPIIKAVLEPFVEPVFEDIAEDLKNECLEKIETIPVWSDYTQTEQKNLIENFVNQRIESYNIQISESEKHLFVEDLIKTLSGFGAVQYLLDKDNVSAVIVNGCKSIHIEIDGKILNTESRLDEKELNILIKSIAGLGEIKGDICNIKTNKYYITVIGANVCTDGVNITIRKIQQYTQEQIIKNGMMTKEVFDFILSLIKEKKNIIISGEINSGKTILLDVLVESCLKTQRVYLIESDPQISSKSDTIVKFVSEKSQQKYKDIIMYIQKSYPDYFISDTNFPDADFSDLSPKIITVRSSSIENTIKELSSSYIQSGFIEKYAKQRVLTDYDYIIRIKKSENGSIILDSISELSPAKTMASSIKTVFKLNTCHRIS